MLDSAHQRVEAVVEQYDFGGVLGDVGTGFAHGDTDIGPFESRSVIDTVTGHGDDVAALFDDFNDPQLILGRDT